MDALLTDVENDTGDSWNKSSMYQIGAIESYEQLEPTKHNLLICGVMRDSLPITSKYFPQALICLIQSFEHTNLRAYKFQTHSRELNIADILDAMQYANNGNLTFIKTAKFLLRVKWIIKGKYVFVEFNCFKKSNTMRNTDDPDRCSEFLNACLQFSSYNSFSQLVKMDQIRLFEKIYITKSLCSRTPYGSDQKFDDTDDCCVDCNYKQIRSLRWKPQYAPAILSDSESSQVDDNLDTVKYTDFADVFKEKQQNDKKIFLTIAWKIKAADPCEKMYSFLVRNVRSLSNISARDICFKYESGVDKLINEYTSKTETDCEIWVWKNAMSVTKEISAQVYELVCKTFNIRKTDLF
eukprot:250656_1